ncbi:phytoene desaturase family protein [Rhodoligotrophos defluvii]|uniref:phytoene desaturase family protein n=1 Tax=Rhodoligotrophos defluvii TaxID=2561934 RepID=UPI001EF0C10D|nr:phytoene desaturase family protein [Rhodoligotrophos defluvii]
MVVIGAGPGGLASAMLLAAKGAKVTVVERLPQVGGRTGRWRQDGFTFDIGPTFFLYPRVLEDIFRECGRDLWTELRFERIDPMYRVLFENAGHLDARSDAQSMAAEIARLSPEDAAHLPRYLADNRKKLASFRPVLESPFNALTDYLKGDVLKSLFMLRPQLSLDRDLRKYFRDRRVRQAFSFQAKYLGMSPFNCPSLFTILAFLEHEFGIWHPIGGHAVVMDKMAEIARDMGVEIRLQEPAVRILFEGRRAVGVETTKGRYPADALVINADFGHAMGALIPNHLRRRWTDRNIAAKKYSCSTFMMYLGIDGLYEDVPHHSIMLAEDLEANIRDIQDGRVLPKAPSIYLQNAGVTDPSLAPRGMSTLYVLVPVAHVTGAIDWPRVVPQFREQVIDRLELMGVKHLRERIRFEKILTPQGWRNDLAIYKGATFNLSHTLGQMLYFRPHNRFEDLDRIYLVGGGTHPGSGLPVIFESARISTRLLAADLALEAPSSLAAATVMPPMELELEKV